jgi:CheY-like chemotaxis protein
MRNRARTRPLVLLADDTADVREMYGMYLNMVGYHVETAADGREAVRFARVSRPDVIIMDLQMPDMDGWAAIRELQRDARTASIPVIVLTGHDLKDYLRWSAMAEGAVSYLMKPTPPEALANHIARCVEQHSTKHRPAV